MEAASTPSTSTVLLECLRRVATCRPQTPGTNVESSTSHTSKRHSASGQFAPKHEPASRESALAS